MRIWTGSTRLDVPGIHDQLVPLSAQSIHRIYRRIWRFVIQIQWAWRECCEVLLYEWGEWDVVKLNSPSCKQLFTRMIIKAKDWYLWRKHQIDENLNIMKVCTQNTPDFVFLELHSLSKLEKTVSYHWYGHVQHGGMVYSLLHIRLDKYRGDEWQSCGVSVDT